MHLTIVGSSGSASSADSACSCYLVEADGYRLLLELGSGAVGPLQRHVAPSDVDAVVLSHAHGDHWADLPQLGYLRRRVGCGPLPVVAAADLPPVVWSQPEVFDAVPARAGELRLGPLPVRLAPVEHRGQCWASRVADALCYTADTRPCAALDALADGCGVLLAEASGSDADAPLRGGHLTAGDAARLATRSGARLLVLTHLRSWQDPAALLEEAAAVAACPVVLAHPGLRVAL